MKSDLRSIGMMACGETFGESAFCVSLKGLLRGSHH